MKLIPNEWFPLAKDARVFVEYSLLYKVIPPDDECDSYRLGLKDLLISHSWVLDRTFKDEDDIIEWIEDTRDLCSQLVSLDEALCDRLRT